MTPTSLEAPTPTDFGLMARLLVRQTFLFTLDFVSFPLFFLYFWGGGWGASSAISHCHIISYISYHSFPLSSPLQQVLCALEQMHSAGVCHGDIKTENILVTSWSWVLLADLASFKPVYVPVDNPADFNFFFDTSRRR